MNTRSIESAPERFERACVFTIAAARAGSATREPAGLTGGRRSDRGQDAITPEAPREGLLVGHVDEDFAGDRVLHSSVRLSGAVEWEVMQRQTRRLADVQRIID